MKPRLLAALVPLSALAVAALAPPAAADPPVVPVTKLKPGPLLLAPAIRTLNVAIDTGDDDLRQDSEVHVGVELRSGETLEVPFARGERFPDRTQAARDVRLPRAVPVGDIRAVKVRFVQGPARGLTRGADEWWMTRVTFIGIATDGRSRVLYTGAPMQKFSNGNTWEAPATSESPRAPRAARLCMKLQTGSDDLRGDSGATVQAEYDDGRLVEGRFVGSGGGACLAIPAGYADRGLRKVRVRMSRGGAGNFASGPATRVDSFVLAGVHLAAEEDGRTRPLWSASPMVRMTGHGVWESADLAETPYAPPASVQSVRLRALTGNDDLRGRATFGVELADGRVISAQFGSTAGAPVTVTPAGQLVENTRTGAAHATGDTWITLPPGTSSAQIRRVVVTYATVQTGPGAHDQWDLAGVEVAANAGGAIHRLWSSWKVDYRFRNTDTWRSDVLPTFRR